MVGMFDWFRKSAKAVTIDTPPKLEAAIRAQNMVAGISVSPDAAFKQATVFSCVRVRGETFAQLSPVVYEQKNDGSKVRRNDHWLARLLRESPGRDLTPFEYLEKISNDFDLRGDHFAYKVVSGERVTELIPLHPDDVEVTWNRAERRRRYKVAGLEVRSGADGLSSRQILHIPRMLSKDRTRGITPLTQCRNSLGLTLAIERHGATTFTNGAAPSGVLEFPHVLKDDQAVRLQKDLDENWNGDRANRTMILESGGKFKPTSLLNKDAEFLNSRKFQRNDICGMFRVPPHLVGDLERSTFSNIEQQSLEFVLYGIVPDAARVESAINSTLLDGTPFYLEFLIESLIRGDYKTRMEGYQLAIQNSIMTPNEARRKENLPALPMGGDESFMMANVVPLRVALQGEASQANSATDLEKALGFSLERVSPASRVNGNGVSHGI